MESVIRSEVGDWLRALAAVPDDPILEEMHALAAERGFPIVGPEVGRLLAQAVRLTSARRVFEFGSGFGYSTLWIARALLEGGTVHHTESDPANVALARDFLGRAGVLSRVQLRATRADDRDTRGIREYIRRMWGDPRFLSSLLPVRDGVGMSLRLT